ncbi:cyclophilin-type peptidyl-prolyl cis-trans isomerase-15, partial [Aphelenchoides avenae]
MAGTTDDVEQPEPTASVVREVAEDEPMASEGIVTTEAEATVEVTTVTTKVTVKRKLEEEQGAEEPPEAEELPASEPVKQKKLKFEDVYLRAIPRASQYEKSFMHRDVITHVIATKTDFIITASQDGHLKFWKKKHNEGIEFVKHFRCHLHEFSCIAVNHNGTLMATVCTADKSVK